MCVKTNVPQNLSILLQLNYGHCIKSIFLHNVLDQYSLYMLMVPLRKHMWLQSLKQLTETDNLKMERWMKGFV